MRKTYICPDLTEVDSNQLWKMYLPLKDKFTWTQFVREGGYIPIGNYQATMALLRVILSSLKAARIENAMLKDYVRRYHAAAPTALWP